jgi:hypothetical protein
MDNLSNQNVFLDHIAVAVTNLNSAQKIFEDIEILNVYMGRTGVGNGNTFSEDHISVFQNVGKCRETYS